MYHSNTNISLQHEARAGNSREFELFRLLLQPHFLFNSLNNLYALAIKQSDQTTSAIAGLSGLLEKVVAYSRQDYISLEQEIGLIRDYIRLERIWLGEGNFLYDMQVSGDTGDFMVPPLVLYTFIENCFKHGIRRCRCEGWMKVKIEVKEQMLLFQSSNLTPKGEGPGDDQITPVTGLGIAAVKKLLEKRCQGHYLLETGMRGQTYFVELRIGNQKSKLNQLSNDL